MYSKPLKYVFRVYTTFGGEIQNTEDTVHIHWYPSVMTVKLML